MYVCMYACMFVWLSLIPEYGSTVHDCQSCSWSAEHKKWKFPCPRSRLRIWSRETVSAVPSRISLLILHIQGKAGANLRDSSRFPRRRPFIYTTKPSGQSRVYQVRQLRIDGVHCRESSGSVSVVLKVVPVTGAAFSGITMDQIMCASLFPHPLMLCGDSLIEFSYKLV